jgi:hypothetical protein
MIRHHQMHKFDAKTMQMATKRSLFYIYLYFFIILNFNFHARFKKYAASASLTAKSA